MTAILSGERLFKKIWFSDKDKSNDKTTEFIRQWFSENITIYYC